MDKEIKKIPSESKSDYAHETVRALLQAIPFGGGAALEIFNNIIVPPIQKRRDIWMRKVSEAIVELDEKYSEFSIDSLKDNEQFITTILEATQSAIRTHHEEKLEALKNIVLNTALKSDLIEDIQHIFIQYINEMTPSHIRILKYFNNPSNLLPQNAPNYTMGGPSTIFEIVYPDYKQREAFYNLIIDSLYNQGLISINSDNMNTTMTSTGMYEPRSTGLGKQFLKFIEIS